MDEARRRRYLNAMGVTVWTPRNGAVQGSAEPRLAVSAQPAAWQPPPERDVAGSIVQSAEPPSPPSAAIETSNAKAGGLTSGPDPATMGWDELAAAVAGCRACGLCDTRTQTVFGVGNREARLMVIGEAPGADEDRAGEPFVGRAGQLLNRMLAAIGLPREQVYIANVLKCRPPGNRDPRPEEASQCQAYLMRQMDLIQPRLILAVGRISAQQLLRTDESVGRLRGRWFEFGPASTPLRVTYHPAYLLRSPEQKAKAWDDLTMVWRRLNRPETD